MTAPASPPHATDEQLTRWEKYAADTLKMLGEIATDDRIFAFQRIAWEAFPSLLAEVRSSRLAAERAEGLATSLEGLLAALDRCVTTVKTADDDLAVTLAWGAARAALAAYRGSAGGAKP